MQNTLKSAIFCMIILACNPAIDKNKSKVNEGKTTSSNIEKKFFEFDAIDYYTIDFKDSKNKDLYENKSKSGLDSFKKGVLLGKIPRSISDLAFIDMLDNIGYKKIPLDKSKFEGINTLFAEKSTSEHIATTCIYVYRDILIFKKDNTVVGTAKVCFDCLAHQIKGTNANTENFGQNGDYERLAKLLQN